jgi:3',5'-cyclic-AMP phosphodiesterase
MLIAQLSDTHILAPGAEPPGPQRAANLAACVADIVRRRPDAVVYTGDTVQHGAPAEYAYLRTLLAPLEVPLYLVPGNRDDRAAMRTAFGDLLGGSDSGDFVGYAIEDHPLRLVALDSTVPGERKGVFDAPRQAWLDETLAAQPRRPTLLFIHHPPFDVGDHYVGGYRDARDAAALADVVRRHPQVVRLLCGHVHWPVEQAWAGTTASIVPSVAVDVRKGVDEAQAHHRPIYFAHRWDGARLVSEAMMVDASN